MNIRITGQLGNMSLSGRLTSLMQSVHALLLTRAYHKEYTTSNINCDTMPERTGANVISALMMQLEQPQGEEIQNHSQRGTVSESLPQAVERAGVAEP